MDPMQATGGTATVERPVYLAGVCLLLSDGQEIWVDITTAKAIAWTEEKINERTEKPAHPHSPPLPKVPKTHPTLPESGEYQPMAMATVQEETKGDVDVCWYDGTKWVC